MDNPTVTAPPVAVNDLTIDINHSSLEFAVRYLRTSRIRGRLDEFSGQLTGAANPQDFSAARLTFQAPVRTINTNQALRDEHLRDANWFDAAQFPDMRFESSAFRPTGPDAYEVDGQLTLKGQTKPVVLHAQFRGTAQDAQGESRAGFSFQTAVNRRDFNILAGPQDVGGYFLSDEVDLSGEISLLVTNENPLPAHG